MKNKMLTNGALILSSIGAINWGLTKFLNFDVLSVVPTGMFTTVVVAAIAASGGFIIYELYSKRI